MKMTATIFGTLIAASFALAAWYQFDRQSALEAACEIGFPNFSRPTDIPKAALGCAIVGAKGTYSGVLVTGHGGANFTSSDFSTIRGQLKRADNRSSFHCPNAGCGSDLANQLAREYECIGGGLAAITVEGRATISNGKYGHLGGYPREFYATRVLKVSPAPEAMIRNWIENFRKRGLC